VQAVDAAGPNWLGASVCRVLVPVNLQYGGIRSGGVHMYVMSVVVEPPLLMQDCSRGGILCVMCDKSPCSVAHTFMNVMG
jgi:hypothetical protein